MFKALLVGFWLVGCTSRNPAFCDLDEDCLNGFRCDDTHSCVEIVVECQTSPDCLDAVRPVCEDNVCRTCVLDDECTSLVCRPDGACEASDRVIYAAPAAPSSGECLIDAPCELSFAKSKLTSVRSTIHLAAGTYTLVAQFIVDAEPATIIGDREAVVQSTTAGPSFRVANASSMALRGFALERGVECTGATLAVTELNFDHAAGEIRSWVTATDCAVSVVDSELLASNQHGIAMTGGSLTIAGTRIEGSLGNGVLCTTSTCSLTTSQIVGSQLIGIDATPVALQVSRSTLTENRQGGVRSLGGTCDVTNNFVFRNGNDKNGTFGGMRLEPASGGTNRIEHNTIVFNDCDPFANPAFAGGLFCTMASAPNNLIYQNSAGNNTMPNSQTGGGCNFNGSLIVNGDGTNQLHFVSPVSEPFDYHLADPLSPAANTGLAGAVSEDFDGELRVNPPDIGADEFTP